jgi:CDP-diacylglycerol--glycerol-3-phosphate 3-phosphatidyltransferase
MKRKRGALREEILNPPNLVTLARIALIPLFVTLLSSESRRNSFLAALVFGAASATDFLDGYLARRLQLITTFGKFLDPLADKLITMAAYIVLVYLDRVPAWVVLVILSREFIISGLRTIAISEGMVIAASQGGKWKTALQLAGAVALIVNYQYPIDFLVGPILQVNFHAVGLVLTYASLIPSIWSAVDYFRGFIDGVFEQREDREDDRPEPAPPLRPAPPPASAPERASGMAVGRR